MKNLLLTCCVLTLIFSSCKKETGPAGANGANGNANIKSFIFTDPISFGYLFTDTLPGVTYSSIDSSLVLAYVQGYVCASNWYTAPGIGCNGSYSTRVFTNKLMNNQTLFVLELRNIDGSVDISMTESVSKLKVIIAPVSSVVTGKKEQVDFSDYHATCRYLNIAE